MVMFHSAKDDDYGWGYGHELLAPPRPLSNRERLIIWRAKMSLYCESRPVTKVRDLCEKPEWTRERFDALWSGDIEQPERPKQH